MLGIKFTVFVIMFIIPLLCFLYWNYDRPTSLLNGFFGIFFFGGTYLTLVLIVEEINQGAGFILALPGIILFLLVAVFGIFATVFYLFLNERTILKKEGFSFTNLLPLLTSIAIIVFEIGMFILTITSESALVTMIAGFLTFIFTYSIGIFILYFATSFLYNHYPLFGKVDYIIVLGAGLIDGERVTPLLASRINVAYQLYQKQQLQKQHSPKIILSGGQGGDEKLPEAEAMRNYMVEQGYELENVLLETKSMNTAQNLEFSTQIMKEERQIESISGLKIVIASNNYHILRAGKLAQKMGIKARGIGSKTKGYYLPTAFIREFIGYLEMSKRKHLVVAALTFLMYALLYFVTEHV